MKIVKEHGLIHDKYNAYVVEVDGDEHVKALGIYEDGVCAYNKMPWIENGLVLLDDVVWDFEHTDDNFMKTLIECTSKDVAKRIVKITADQYGVRIVEPMIISVVELDAILNYCIEQAEHNDINPFSYYNRDSEPPGIDDPQAAVQRLQELINQLNDMNMADQQIVILT